jgi:hypothetical protein
MEHRKGINMYWFRNVLLEQLHALEVDHSGLCTRNSRVRLRCV